jgi:hypothetical protein
VFWILLHLLFSGVFGNSGMRFFFQNIDRRSMDTR